MTRKQKKKLRLILCAAVLLAVAWALTSFVFPDTLVFRILGIVCYLIPYLFVGHEVLRTSAIHIAHGQVFDENFLMAVATIGAFCCGEYPEAVFVMLFFEIGDLFENIAVGKSRKSISSLMEIRPDEANVLRDGEILTVSPDEVAVGETIVIRPGEKVPIDGVVIDGAASLNTTALTGESLPRDVEVGDDVISGCVCMGGVLRVKTAKAFGESTVSKILDLVENASVSKAKSENFITRFARWYTPAVVIAALALAILPPIFDGEWIGWIRRALTFLVVSCPCALVISVPLSFFGGIGGAARRGILIKGSNYMETLARTGIAVFDKTGTLTHGSFSVTAVHPEQLNRETLLELAAAAECHSSHPISLSLREAFSGFIAENELTDIREIAGQGVTVRYRGNSVAVGNEKLMESIGAAWRGCHHVGTIVHVAYNGEYAGHIVISDRPKENAVAAMEKLRGCGVNKTVMLTGDNEAVAAAVAQEIGVDEYYAGLLPGDKVARVETLLSERKKGESLLFVGDGINDAPVLARADVGVAMGALGSDAAIEAADVVLMDDDPEKLAEAITLSRRTMRIVRENIFFALAVKALALLLGALGIAGLWEAVFADVGVMVLAVLNAMRTLRMK